MSSPAFADYPSLTLEVDFTAGALIAASTWTDITGPLMAGGTRTGRQRLLEAFDPGTAWFDLDNSNGAFDPLNAAGPYFGNLKPLRQIRLRVVWATVTYELWRGYVDGWPQSYPDYGLDAVVHLTATDGFVILQRAKLPDSVWVATVADLAPHAWYRMAEETGTQMADASGHARHGTYIGGATFNHRGSRLAYAPDNGVIELDGVDDGGIVPLADVFPQIGAYSYALWLRTPDPLPTAIAEYVAALYSRSSFSKNDQRSAWLVIDWATGTLIATNEENDNIGQAPRTNQPLQPGQDYLIGVTYSGTAGGLKLYVNGVLQNTLGTTPGGADGSVKDLLYVGGPTSDIFKPWPDELGELLITQTELTAGDMADLWVAATAPWDGDTSGARIGLLADLVGWPASLRDLDAGTSILGPALLGDTALERMQLVERTEAGLLYMDGAGRLTLVSRTAMRTEARFVTSQGTYGPGAGEIPYSDIETSGWDWQSIWNVARVGREGGTPQEYRDPGTSIAEYGESYADDETDLLMRGDGEALDRAAWKVRRFKDPAYRVDSLTIRPRQPVAAVTALTWPQVLGRQIGDRVTVKVDPIGSAATTVDCHIEGIEHTFSPLEWETTFALSSADPNELLYAVVGSGAARNRVGTAKAGY